MGFGKVSSRASAGEAGNLTSLRPRSVSRPARFVFATAISRFARRRLRSIAPDAVQSNRCVGRYHEVESGTGWTAFSEWCGQSTGGNVLFAHESYAHDPARCMRFKIEERANLVGSEITGHFFCAYNVRRPTSDAERQMLNDELGVEQP